MRTKLALVAAGMLRSSRAILALTLAALGILGGLLPDARAQKLAGRFAAATENQLATRAAISMLEAGGNAVDAAVTAALVAGVTSPTSSGIGGGGFALVWLAAEQKAILLDFRETAPLLIDAAAFEARPLPDPMRGKLVGVPGEVKGLFELQQRFGVRKWLDIVGPAVRFANAGFPAGRHLATTLAASPELMSLDAGLRAVFYPSGKPAAVGQVLKNPKLGATLTRIAAEGPSAFYTGSVAREIVSAARAVQGAVSAAELQAYKPIERQPLHVRWEGYDVYTMPPPSAGGLMLAQTLKLFKKDELKRLGIQSGAYQHMVAEALRAALADRMRYVGDPDHVKVDVERLLSAERMAQRRRNMALDRTHAVPRFGLEEAGTHHLVTADARGNVVSLTTTVNRTFGAKITAPDSGIVLNDELDDFTQTKDVLPFSMQESPNRPRPGARPVSSMTPTVIVKDGQAVLALGGSGGPTIPVNVTQLVLARLVFDQKPAEAVAARRFYVPTRGPFIMLEEGAPRALIENLEARGEIVGTMRFKTNAVQMIAVEGNRKLAAADPRKYGAAEVR